MNDLLTKADYVKVGYIGGLFGYEGDLRFTEEEFIREGWIADIGFLYFIENGMYVPRFIISRDERQSLIRFARYHSRESARELTDQDVYLRQRDFPGEVSEEDEHGLNWHRLQGYIVVDGENGSEIGIIESAVEYPGGWMAEVRVEGRSDLIMIPLAEPLIQELNLEQKRLIMDLPEGLLDL